MKIFILGSTGLLGSHVAWNLNQFHKVELVPRRKLDASKAYSRSHFLRSLPIQEGDYVINCIGVLKPQIKNENHAIRVNGLFPHALANYCSATGAKLIHFSSDCVFSGIRGGYTEVDTPDSEDIYGITKSMEPSNKSLVLRTSFIGEELYHKRSLVSWLISKKGQEIKGYTNCHWNGVTCISLAKIVTDIVLNHKYALGLRHVFSPNIISKFELCSTISRIYNLKIDIKPHKAKEISGTKINKNLDRSLSSVYAEPLMPEYTILEQIKEQKCTKIQKLGSE